MATNVEQYNREEGLSRIAFFYHVPLSFAGSESSIVYISITLEKKRRYESPLHTDFTDKQSKMNSLRE